MSYPWYEIVAGDSEITQGEVIFQCPVPITIKTDKFPFFKGGWTYKDVIVMTQACDLAHGKVDQVLLCPIGPFRPVLREAMLKDSPTLDFEGISSNTQKEKKQKYIDKFDQGLYQDYYLLNRHDHPSHFMGYRVVYLREPYNIPQETLKMILQDRHEQRLRLLPPYREHLTQAFTKNFMRIGLPINLNIKADDI